MSWAPTQKPEVRVRPVGAISVHVQFGGLPYYFISLGESERGGFASYHHLPRPQVSTTELAVTAPARVRDEDCFEIQRTTTDLDGSVISQSTFYVALREHEVAWLLRIRRRPGALTRVDEATATFPRHLEVGLEFGHRRVRGVVDVLIDEKPWRCIEVESVGSGDPHLTRLYIASDGRQVYNRRLLRADAPTPYAIPHDSERLPYQGAEYVPYYEDFAQFVLS
ncbi:MAG: hypothetical protein PVH68_12210 [Armatimonadota bacterium]|jgi:hypothetical protein